MKTTSRRLDQIGLTALIITFVALFGFFLVGCDSADAEQRKATAELTKEAHMKVGMPGITNYTERRFFKTILELRDTEVQTYSYFMDMNGGLHLLCNSIGYGLPASVQYTNPERRISNSGGVGTISQADPNGLFMPEGLDATYVLCTDESGEVKPVYTEPKIIVSPFPLKTVDDLQ